MTYRARILLIFLTILFPAPSWAYQILDNYVVVEPGESLWGISKQIYNNPNCFVDLWNRREKTSLVKNPNLIFPGMRFEVVEKPVCLKANVEPSTHNNLPGSEENLKKIYLEMVGIKSILGNDNGSKITDLLKRTLKETKTLRENQDLRGFQYFLSTLYAIGVAALGGAGTSILVISVRWLKKKIWPKPSDSSTQ